MNRKYFALFSALEITFWGFHASFIAFASAYMLSCGVSNTTVSLLLSGFLLCAFAGSVIFGGMCDRYQTNKRVFIPCMLAVYALTLIIYFHAGNVPVLSVCYPLLGFFFQPQGANVDAWVLSHYDHDQGIYGKIRSLPSLFYAVICAGMGRLIGVFGYQVTPVCATGFMLLMIVCAAVLPDAHSLAAAQTQLSAQDVKRLFASAPYRRLIVLLFLIGLAIAPVNNLKIVLLENVGGDVSHVGLDSFVSALTQVPFIAMAGMLALLTLRVRFMAMAFLLLTTILLVRFAASPAMIFAGSFFYNVAYGVLLVTMREVTERFVSEDLRNLGHNLSDAVFSSFSGVISLMCAGAIVDRLGVSAMVTICALIAVIPAVLSMKKLHN